MEGRVCIVTGSNSGIGKETAIALAEKGAHVVMIVRSRERGERARREIIEQTGNANVDMLLADLSSMEQIRRVAQEFRSKYDRLDVLINNAGAIFWDKRESDEGYEMTFALNHLAPFLLTYELIDLMISSQPARIINVSSGAHSFGEIDFDDPQSEDDYGAFKSYASAKLMNITFTYALARRLEGAGVTANVLHPGFVRTNFGKGEGSRVARFFFRLLSVFAKSPKKGAETSVYLAVSDEVQGITGEYWKDCVTSESKHVSYDKETQEELWSITEDMLGLSWEKKLSQLPEAVPKRPEP